MNVLNPPVPSQWLLEPIDPYGSATIELVGQMEGPPLYAVRKRGWCLNKKGTWDYEPQPSSRTDRWRKAHRFSSFEGALAGAMSAEECP